MFRCGILSEVDEAAPFGIGVSSNRISATGTLTLRATAIAANRSQFRSRARPTRTGRNGEWGSPNGFVWFTSSQQPK